MLILPVLLLLIVSLTLWLLHSSKTRPWIKILGVVLFMGFCGVFATSLDTFFGWGAKSKLAPEIVEIKHVEIKEPFGSNKGGIYILMNDIMPKRDTSILSVFGYKMEKSEPRLFKYDYSRDFHEQLEKEVMPALRDGQSVRGKMGKRGGTGKGKGNGKEGQGKGRGNGKGEGSDSLKEDAPMFYKLEPRFFQPKEAPPDTSANRA